MQPNNARPTAAHTPRAWLETFANYRPQVIRIIHLLERWEPAPPPEIVCAEAPGAAVVEAGREPERGGEA